MSEEQIERIFDSISQLSDKVDGNTDHFKKRFDILESEMKDVKTAITGNSDMGQMGIVKRQEHIDGKAHACNEKIERLEKKMLIAGVLLLGISLGPDGLKLISKLF